MPRFALNLTLAFADLPLERARLTGLLEVGRLVGIHVVWVADSARRIPKT